MGRGSPSQSLFIPLIPPYKIFCRNSDLELPDIEAPKQSTCGATECLISGFVRRYQFVRVDSKKSLHSERPASCTVWIGKYSPLICQSEGSGGVLSPARESIKFRVIKWRELGIQTMHYCSKIDSSTSALMVTSLRVTSATFSPSSTDVIEKAIFTPEMSR